ncbi:MAG: imidazoleglycerol-phosphate dehydratase HisB [Desulfocucumaceae bacterium]
MTLRKGYIERKTMETDIKLEFLPEGDGMMQGTSGIGFLDHMLVLLCKHGGFGLKLEASGDLQVDGHHTVEDIGLCLGEAFNSSLGDKRGLGRYGSMLLPMDEALVLCATDISGRAGLYYEAKFLSEKIGDFDTELIQVFWQAFASAAKATIHIKQLSGGNSHHIAEAIFKGMGRALKGAAKIEGDELPSSKGVL